MRTRRLPAILVALTVIAAGLFAGCGYKNDATDVQEGAPLELGNLQYNVMITRYLNPSDTEDRAYLQGAPKLPNGETYLGVFLQVQNTGDQTEVIPQDMKVVDTEGQEFSPAPLHNDFSLDLGSKLQANDVIPNPESAAANGPIQGSMILFLISEASIEDRPLELVIPAPDGSIGEIQLDL